MDVHGAGAQRSDAKVGNGKFHGPQGDAVRSNNYVICVRGGNVKNESTSSNSDKYPLKLTIKENRGSIRGCSIINYILKLFCIWQSPIIIICCF